jgi:pyridoxal phosphate enzyme (YggS family)
MDYISQNINKLRAGIPSHVRLVVVSKTKTIQQIRAAMAAGHTCFGESKVQEIIQKQKEIPNVKWHLIGHLQTNKVKYIASFIDVIQSVDSLGLLQEINKQANKHNRVIDCLLQIHIAQEKTKFGFSQQAAVDLLNGFNNQGFKNVRICGLMGMATFTDDTELVRREFRTLSDFFKQLKTDYFPNESSFCELSMGMSDDYHIAIQEGATIIRVGSSIFKE